MEKINLVWFKRDLRLTDHAPLKSAIEEGLPLLLVYFLEPALKEAAQSDPRHWRFIRESLADTNQKLGKLGTRIHVFHYPVLSGLYKISAHYVISQIFSHQETGIGLTFERDKQVKQFCLEKGITWKEYKQQGVDRGRKDRTAWSRQWHAFMEKPMAEPDLPGGHYLNEIPQTLRNFSVSDSISTSTSSPDGRQQGGDPQVKTYNADHRVSELPAEARAITIAIIK